MFEGLGMSGAILVRPGRVWNAPWLRFRASGERLGGLGTILERLGRILEGFWRVLEASWELSGSIFGSFYAILSNMGK